MELTLQNLPFASFTTRRIKLGDGSSSSFCTSRWFFINPTKSKEARVRKSVIITSGLAETAASIAVAATVVGGAATLLARRTKASQEVQVSQKTCQECGGSGICSECRGEGFVLKRLSEGTAEKARLNAKNMATRYTAGLPKKWSYCAKCSSARSCSLCGGTGKLAY